MNKIIKARACPNCGCFNPHSFRISSSRLPWYYLECPLCHWRGKTKLFLKRAIKSWNKKYDKILKVKIKYRTELYKMDWRIK